MHQSMHHYLKRFVCSVPRVMQCAALCATVVSHISHAQTSAQDYPVKPITIIVGYAPGGNADLRMRHFAPVLSSILGKPVLVENKAGAGGNIGTDFVAKAAPDGYTIGTGSFGPLGVNRALFANLPYDPIKDLAPVVLIEKGPLVLVSNLDRPFKSVADVINAARARPGELTIANVVHAITEFKNDQRAVQGRCPGCDRVDWRAG
jgi:tripartite-type tricarboxylate transporter receptor subunit TctC